MKHFVTWTKTFLVMWTFFIATKVIENFLYLLNRLNQLNKFAAFVAVENNKPQTKVRNNEGFHKTNSNHIFCRNVR